MSAPKEDPVCAALGWVVPAGEDHYSVPDPRGPVQVPGRKYKRERTPWTFWEPDRLVLSELPLDSIPLHLAVGRVDAINTVPNAFWMEVVVPYLSKRMELGL